MDHDTGFAPHIENKICVVSGCKKNTIEKWAKRGSWVIGIGGNKTGKPNKLIYTMEVEEKLLYEDFKRKYPKESEYLSKEKAGTNVLISRNFYYFGNNAINLPENLKEDILIDRQGCKCVIKENINKLRGYLSTKGYNRYGKFGEPNNREDENANKCKKC